MKLEKQHCFFNKNLYNLEFIKEKEEKNYFLFKKSHTRKFHNHFIEDIYDIMKINSGEKTIIDLSQSKYNIYSNLIIDSKFYETSEQYGGLRFTTRNDEKVNIYRTENDFVREFLPEDLNFQIIHETERQDRDIINNKKTVNNIKIPSLLFEATGVKKQEVIDFFLFKDNKQAMICTVNDYSSFMIVKCIGLYSELRESVHHRSDSDYDYLERWIDRKILYGPHFRIKINKTKDSNEKNNLINGIFLLKNFKCYSSSKKLYLTISKLSEKLEWPSFYRREFDELDGKAISLDSTLEVLTSPNTKIEWIYSDEK